MVINMGITPSGLTIASRPMKVLKYSAISKMITLLDGVLPSFGRYSQEPPSQFAIPSVCATLKTRAVYMIGEQGQCLPHRIGFQKLKTQRPAQQRTFIRSISPHNTNASCHLDFTCYI
jgi:hypothetical protein